MTTPDTFMSLSQAAKLLGKHKGTLSNHIKNGTLSAKKAGSQGYKIDPAELARVYPDEWKAAQGDNPSATGKKPLNVTGSQPLITPSKNTENTSDVKLAVQEVELKHAHEQIADLKDQLDRERKAREKAEKAAEDEREESKRLTLMIAGPQATQPEQDEPEKPKRGKLARFLFGGEDR